MALAEDPDGGLSLSRATTAYSPETARALADHATDGAIPAQPFSYSPLRTPQALRILQILPARSDTEPIRCTIQTIERETAFNVVYKALSYTWGDTSTLLPISLNRHTTYVTYNLHEAMLHLRITHPHTNLWIDAVCIDQVNLHERMHQVNQMRRIYSEAEEVIAWLGPKDEDVERLFQFIEQETEDHGDDCRSSQCAFHSRDTFSVRHHIHLRNCLASAMEILESRPYWCRVWIIQEVIVAKRVVLLSGTNTLMWSDFVKFRAISKTAAHPLFNATPAARVIHSLATWPRNSTGLAQALLLSQSSIATDSKDKIYAILGLVNRGAGQNLSADYTLAPCTVFCLAVRALILDWAQEVFDGDAASLFHDEQFRKIFLDEELPIKARCVEIASRYMENDIAQSGDTKEQSCNGMGCGSQFTLRFISGHRRSRYWDSSCEGGNYWGSQISQCSPFEDVELRHILAFWATLNELTS